MVTDNSTMPHNVVFISKMILEMYTVHCVKTMDTHNPEKREKENIIIFFFFFKRSDKRAHSHPSFTMCCVVCTLCVYSLLTLICIYTPGRNLLGALFGCCCCFHGVRADRRYAHAATGHISVKTFNTSV